MASITNLKFCDKRTCILKTAAPCLTTPIHRRSFLTRICRAKQWPFSPSGEKVADRPDEGAFAGGRGPKRAPHPSPLPQFFASILPSNNSLSLRKKSRERGQHGAVQPSTCSLNQAPSTCFFDQAPVPSTKHEAPVFLTKHLFPQPSTKHLRS